MPYVERTDEEIGRTLAAELEAATAEEDMDTPVLMCGCGDEWTSRQVIDELREDPGAHISASFLYYVRAIADMHNVDPLEVAGDIERDWNLGEGN